jgi:GNAT superfamily N-acetyltransferase
MTGNRAIRIRRFTDADAPRVRALFIATNRQLSPPLLRNAFKAYIERALAEEIDRIADYYREHDGGFWVAIKNEKLVGIFGLERADADAMELRRMYVDVASRRRGIGRQILDYAEAECRRRGIARLVLSTAAMQEAAVTLYRSAGYRLVREDVAEMVSNKTVGSGLRRFHFDKIL